MFAKVVAKAIGCLVLALALAPAVVWAQTDTASIVGTVRDSSGAVMPGVTVTATQTGTAVALPAVTNSSGCSTASGRTNSPAGGASRTSSPRRAWLTRCSDTSPPRMRLTVMAMRPSRRRGTDVSE